MKKITTNRLKQAAYGNDKWEYKGHLCEMDDDVEYGPEGPENVKIWHTVTTPDGKRLTAPISPYDNDRKTVELWIDAGYPEQCVMGNCDQDELRQMLADQGQVPPIDDPAFFDIKSKPFPE
tara:strand:- start:163 stop:525 length:363 start_codon:yes stop_codon:yes gene_type:complete